MLKRVIGFFGIFFILIGTCMVVPFILALAYGEYSSAKAFACAIAFAYIIGFFIKKNYHLPSDQVKLKLRDSYFIVTVSWLSASVIAGIPFVIQGSIPNPINAFFEMCSGFSTTGATILTNIEAMPKSLLFWRSMTQWLGGMGMIVLVMAILPSLGVKAQNIASAETPGPTVTKLTSRFSGTAQKLYKAYIILTVLQVILYMFGGMNLYDSVCHSFTTMATGGFSTYNDSIAHFNSTYITWVTTVFMVLAGTNFNLYFVAAHNGIRKMFKDEELRLYLKIILVATALTTICLMIKGFYNSVWHALTDAAFQVTTIMSTTGFATTNFDLWPAFCKIIIIALMLVGASSSSTAGGLKVVRVLVSFKMIKRHVKLKIHDNIVNDIRLDGQKIPPATMTYIVSFISFFIFTLAAGTLVVSIDGADILTNFTAVLSCLSNVGPGLNKVGPVCNFEFYSNFSTLVLAFIMIAGRLELNTFFLLLSRHFWSPDKV